MHYKQTLRVYLCSYHPAVMSKGKSYTNRSDLTDYPQYTLEDMDDVKHFIPGVFVEVDVVL